MSERFKYAKNGICRFENFPEHLAADDFPLVYLGKLCRMNWYSDLRELDGKIFPVIYCNNSNSEVKHRVRIHFKLENLYSVENKKNSKKFEKTEEKVLLFDEVSVGFHTPILEILNLKNGWLKNGTLSMEYGIQVEAIMKHKIWRFNFKDQLFNGGVEMVKLYKKIADSDCSGCFYLHAQLLKHHSQVCATLISQKTEKSRFILSTSNNSFLYFEDALQILHGVQLYLKHDRLLSVLSTTSLNKMRNVVHYCDVLLTRRRSRSSCRINRKKWISLANKYELRHWMVELLKPMKSVKDCIDREDIEEMSNESMKAFIAKFVYEKF